MFIVSLHKIAIHAPIGMYPQEQILSNLFEVDVDVYTSHYNSEQFVDYTLLQDIVHQSFAQPQEVLEELVQKMHQKILNQFPFAQKIRISVRKIRPPMTGAVAYAQVTIEK